MASAWSVTWLASTRKTSMVKVKPRSLASQVKIISPINIYSIYTYSKHYACRSHSSAILAVAATQPSTLVISGLVHIGPAPQCRVSGPYPLIVSSLHLQTRRGTYVFLIEANFHPLHSFLIAMTFSFVTSIPVELDGVFSVSSKPSASSTGIVDCDRKALVRYWRDRYWFCSL